MTRDSRAANVGIIPLAMPLTVQAHGDGLFRSPHVVVRSNNGPLWYPLSCQESRTRTGVPRRADPLRLFPQVIGKGTSQ
jgi:hypothetical protein